MTKTGLISISILLLWAGALVNADSQPLSGVRICIDAGHGGHTSNDRQIFLPNGVIYWESEGDLTTALHLENLLTDLGAEVKLTRTENSDESDISLSERTEIANAFGADFFHSIHTNGGGGTYSLVLYKEENNSPSFPLAKEMAEIMGPNLQDLMKTTAHYIRGDYTFLGFNLGVLKFTNMPATLSESSFHDLPDEGLRLKNSEYLKNYAWSIARSFLSYFEVEGFSTGRVGGVITDITSGETVNEVTVTCQPSGSMYTGDNYYNGFYGIGDLNPGNYELTLGKNGYLDHTVPITISANEYLDLDLTIQYYNNGLPNVDFYITGLPAGAGESITFNAEKSTDDGYIDLFEWDFGDGTMLDSGIVVSHSFSMDGSYSVKMTATDNEGNQSSVTKLIEIKTELPSAPKLLSVTHYNDYKGIQIRWKKNPETNIQSYTIFYAEQRNFSDEKILSAVGSDIQQISLDDFGTNDTPYYLRLKAINIASKQSAYSDTYSIYKSGETDYYTILIVDGFNRLSSYTAGSHDFVVSYSEPISAQGPVHISSCSNEAIIDEMIHLADFDIVCWFLGDESTANETFDGVEQTKLKQYLENGGKLFVSGSEIAWDLDEKGSEDDKLFYHNYLKAQYFGDGGPGRAPAGGLDGSGFEGTNLHFGMVYPEDFPDEITPLGGSSLILKYTNEAGAGIGFKGSFGTGNKKGAIVNIGFPLESVADEMETNYFIEKLLAFFRSEEPDTIDTKIEKIAFEQYPNVVGEQLNVYYELPEEVDLELSVFSSSGRKLYYNKMNIPAGKGKKMLDVQSLDTGIYTLKINCQNTNELFRFFKL